MANYWSSTTLGREVAANTTVNRILPGWVTCTACKGSGERLIRGRNERLEECTSCKGTGQVDDETRFRVSYRAPLDQDAPTGADREDAPLVIKNVEMTRNEMRYFALQLWWRSFGPEPIPQPRMARAANRRNALVDQLLDTAEDVMNVRWVPEPFGGGSPFDTYTAEVVGLVTTKLMGNLHVSSFVQAMADDRQLTEGSETDGHRAT